MTGNKICSISKGVLKRLSQLYQPLSVSHTPVCPLGSLVKLCRFVYSPTTSHLRLGGDAGKIAGSESSICTVRNCISDRAEAFKLPYFIAVVPFCFEGNRVYLNDSTSGYMQIVCFLETTLAAKRDQTKCLQK